jgi:sn-2 palmitoyl-lipid 9-desaturase
LPRPPLRSEHVVATPVGGAAYWEMLHMSILNEDNRATSTMDALADSAIDVGPIPLPAAPASSPAAGGGERAASGERWSHGLDWPNVLWIVALHLGALAAPFVFTWQGLVTFFILSWITGGLGVCLGYHRLLTHASFQTYPLVRRLLALLGTLAGEGPPVNWVSVHRKHHRFSDSVGDPHSPRDGAWWSHIVWLFPRPREPQWTKMLQRYGKDLLGDRFMRMLDKTFLLWHIALGTALLGAGWLLWGPATGLSLLVYGMFLRLVWVMHVTWAVNSASHMWGYRNYDTPDDSRNLWWVGLLAYGEGWHNNHHAFSDRARHGHRWWEIDVTYMTIWVLEKLGLAWNVRK